MEFLRSLSAIPWYSWVGALCILFFLAGCMFSVFRIISGTIRHIYLASWTWLTTVVARRMGWTFTSAGTAHWAYKSELAKAGVWNEDNLPLGIWKNGRVIHEPRGSHICLVAPPRSRKSWGVVMPVLRHYRGSVICVDLRGELHQHTSNERATFSHVLRFDPAGSDSASLNVLDTIPWTSPQAFSAVDRVTHHVLAPTGNAIGDEFRSNAIPLLRSIIFDQCDKGSANFPAICSWIGATESTIMDKLQVLLASDNEYVTRGARRTLDMSSKLRQGVWNAIAEALVIFEDPVIRQHTEKSDCLLDELLFAAAPLTIYLTMGFHDVTRLGRFLGLFVETLVTLVSAPHPPARHGLLMVLDEMANLGKLTELEKAVSYLQGSGCQCLFVFQNMNQILDVYGETTPLLSSVSTHVFYTPVPTDLVTSQLIAKALGETTVTVNTWNSYHSDVVTSVVERGRALMTADEVTRLPRTDAIIFTQEHPPIYATKLGNTPPHGVARVWILMSRNPGCVVATTIMLVLGLTILPFTHLPWSTLTQIPASLTEQANTVLRTKPSPLPQPATQEPAASMPNSARTLPSTVGPWKMIATDTNLAGKLVEREEGRYATQEICMTELAHKYEPLMRWLEQSENTSSREVHVTRQADRYRWQTKYPGQKPQTREVRCSDTSS